MLRKEWGRAPARDRGLGRASLRDSKAKLVRGGVGKLSWGEEQQEGVRRPEALRAFASSLVGNRSWSMGWRDWNTTGRSGELRKTARLDFVLRAIGSHRTLGIRMRMTPSYLCLKKSVFIAV